MSKYNNHPEVQALVRNKDLDMDDSDNEDPIILNRNMVTTIKRWMQTPDSVRQLAESHMHKRSDATRAWTERSLRASFLWIGSEVDEAKLGAAGSAASFNCTEGAPKDDENYIMINWSLPLQAAGQEMVFLRWAGDFEKATMNVKASQHSKYRKSYDELHELRLIAGFWQSAASFFEKELGAEDFLMLKADVMNRESWDNEFLRVIKSKPKKMSLSMLPTYRALVIEALDQRQASITAEVDDQRNDVLVALMKYFASAIQRDWERMSSVPIAIKEAATLYHESHQTWLEQEAAKGEKGVGWWLDRNMSINFISKATQAAKPVIDMRRKLTSRLNTKDDEVYCLIYCDANVPNGKTKEGVRSFAEMAKAICDLNPRKTIVVLTLPDVPSGSSAKGLDDDEEKFRKELQQAGRFRNLLLLPPLPPSPLPLLLLPPSPPNAGVLLRPPLLRMSLLILRSRRTPLRGRTSSARSPGEPRPPGLAAPRLPARGPPRPGARRR